MSDARHEEIVGFGKNPVRPDAPVGDPVRYDEEFERLQAQVDRSGSLTGQETEWKVVVELASNILKKKSKDLLVMTYLTLGLFETEGYRRLADAFEAYIEFLRAFWENCYPKVKPPQGRYNAVQYLLERLQPLVELKGGRAKKEPAAGDKEAVHACAARVEEFDKLVSEKFTGMPETPNALPLVRAFKELRSKVGPLIQPGAAPEGSAEAGAGSTGEGGPQATPSTGGGLAGAPSSFATITQAVDQMKRIARYLLDQDKKDPRGYRLSRIALFGSITEAPKDRLIPPAAANARTSLENLATAGDWANLLTQAEAQFLQTPLWLDVQRWVAQALQGLGPPYAAARHAVIFETVALQARLPALFDLAFKDGKPFADGATKAWLAEAGGELGLGNGSAAGASANGDRLAAALSEARKLLTDAKPAQAVSRLRGEIETAGSRRAQFRAQLALAQFCIDMNKPAIAEPLLDGLDALIGRFSLEEWEPGLAAEALHMLYDCMAKSRPRGTPEDLRRRADIFARLCRLDPTAALKLDTAGAAARPAPAAAASAQPAAKPA